MANGNCHRRVAGVLRLAAKCGEVTPIRRELLYTIIIEIRHKDIAFGANRDGRRGGEPALERPVKAQGKRPSPLVQEIAASVKNLDTISVAIGHVESPILSQSHVGWIGKLAGTPASLPGCSPLFDE